jgi:hypothetical protein
MIVLIILQLKRQASADPVAPPTPSTQHNKSPTPVAADSPQLDSNGAAGSSGSKLGAPADLDAIGSPFKRARPSDAAAIDVSSAKKASELFSSTINQASETNSPTANASKGDLKISMDDEEL